MMAVLSPGMRRVIAVGLAMAALAAVALGVVWPAASRARFLQEEIAAQREMLGKLMSMAAIRNATGAQAAQSSRNLAAEVHFAGDSEAVELANLQAAFRSLAKTADVRLQSLRTLTSSPTPGGDLMLAGLHATLQARLEALQMLLHGIEAHRPVLMVEGLVVTPMPVQPGAERVLQIDLRISAFLQKREKTP
ncbi:MAG: type II secretion system protein GspM [Hyphomicrobiaceae bacterium]|nr:type II secretion system protein GspM [Hyphomicrobiaceae bacterium]